MASRTRRTWRRRSIIRKAWTLPVGAQFGRAIKLGKLPINLQLGAYDNALRPQYGSTWQIRSQLTFIF